MVPGVAQGVHWAWLCLGSSGRRPQQQLLGLAGWQWGSEGEREISEGWEESLFCCCPSEYRETKLLLSTSQGDSGSLPAGISTQELDSPIWVPCPGLTAQTTGTRCSHRGLVPSWLPTLPGLAAGGRRVCI